HENVRRVPHHRVVLPHPQRLVELLPVLGGLRCEVLVSPCGTAEQGLLSRAPWKQGISRVHPRLELRRLLQAGLLEHRQGGEQQSETSDRDGEGVDVHAHHGLERLDRKSTRLNSSHVSISYAVFCLK